MNEAAPNLEADLGSSADHDTPEERRLTRAVFRQMIRDHERTVRKAAKVRAAAVRKRAEASRVADAADQAHYEADYALRQCLRAHEQWEEQIKKGCSK